MECFFHTLKTEFVHHRHYATPADATRDIFASIEGFYNRTRRHSVIGFISPIEMRAGMAVVGSRLALQVSSAPSSFWIPSRALDAPGLKVKPIGNYMRVALPPDSLRFSLVERIEKRPTMEELAKEEQLRKKQERNTRLGNMVVQSGTCVSRIRLSSAPANSASRLRINMSEDFVVAGVTASGRKSRVS
jgi:hypothetical protein